VIYLDSSVALAWLFGEDRHPTADFWNEPLTSSRLLQYEVWSRIHGRSSIELADTAVRQILEAVEYVEFSPQVLARALDPFPVHVRTLDALHLATMSFLRDHARPVELASYDTRLLTAARALRIPIREL
jgi:predicted nucleic acid-binding protein